jgi:hypothetical protein
VVIEAVLPLPGSTGKQKQARGKHHLKMLTSTSQKKIFEDRNRKKMEEQEKIVSIKDEPLTEFQNSK